LTKGELARLYAELPTVECQRKCQAFCGPIGMSETEWALICRHLGRTPRGDLRTLVCPMLGADGRCTVYALRPMLCRLWGVTEGMECPHECTPTPRYLTVEEGFAYMLRAGNGCDPMTREEADEFLDTMSPTIKARVRELWVGANHTPPTPEQARYRAPSAVQHVPGPWQLR
jgi:hypothetical protein